MEAKTLSIPRNALHFRGELSIGDNGENTKTSPFRMLARSKNPVPWIMGYTLVNDMAGLIIKKPRLTIDWEHGDQELGYANRLWLEDNDLYASGVVQSFKPDDKSAEIIERSKNGQPYEASVTFDASDVEELYPNEKTIVNGLEVVGPALIMRSWELRGIAICKYGADSNTVTQLKEGDTITLKLNRKNKMDQENLSETVEAVDLTAVDTEQVIIDQATIEPEVATEVEAIAVETLELGEAVEILGGEGITVSKIDNTFTIDLAAVELQKEDEPVELVVEQESLPVVQEEVIDEEKVSLQAELVELKRKLEALSAIGEKQPVTFNAEQSEADVIAKRMTKFQKSLSIGVASAAARIKLPKR